jgi:hypothetical protein
VTGSPRTPTAIRNSASKREANAFQIDLTNAPVKVERSIESPGSSAPSIPAKSLRSTPLPSTPRQPNKRKRGKTPTTRISRSAVKEEKRIEATGELAVQVADLAQQLENLVETGRKRKRNEEGNDIHKDLTELQPKTKRTRVPEVIDLTDD